MTSMTDHPDPEALQRFLALRQPRQDSAPDEPVLMDGDVVVVYLEGRYGAIADAHIWSDPARPADHLAVALAGALEALHDPAAPWCVEQWHRWESNGLTHWMLGINVEGSDLVVPDELSRG